MSQPDSDTESDEAFPIALIAFCIAAGLVVLALILALFTTPVISVCIVGCIAVTIIAVWKKDAIQQYFDRRRKLASERRKAREEAEAAEAAAATAEQDSPATEEPEAAQDTSPTVVEQVPATPEPQQPVIAPPPEFATPDQVAAIAPESPPAQPMPVEPPAAPAPIAQPAVAPEAEAPSAPDTEPQSLTDGLSDKYCGFLEAAMTQSKWPRRDLEAMTRMHDLQWEETFDAINEWSQERFGDPMLVQDGDEVWIQLPLI